MNFLKTVLVLLFLISNTDKALGSSNFCLIEESKNNGNIVYCNDFQNNDLGYYSFDQIEIDWEPLNTISDFSTRYENGVRVVKDSNGKVISGKRVKIKQESNNKYLEVSYPENKFGGFESGAIWRKIIKPHEKLTLEYKVKFNKDFLFKKNGRDVTGKLPGLCGGECNSGYTEDDFPTGDKGWSARYMWDGDGSGLAYIYYNNMKIPSKDPVQPTVPRGGTAKVYPNRYFIDLKINSDLVQKGGKSYQCSFQKHNDKRLYMKFIPGTWHILKQEITMNSLPGQDPKNHNGKLKVSIDGTEVVRCTNLYFRDSDELSIDGFFFNTFFGGGEADSAIRDETIMFDNFLITK